MNRYRTQHDGDLQYYQSMNLVEKKTRRGRPYSPYTIFEDGGCRETTQSKRIALNNNEIESTSLIAQIIADNQGRFQLGRQNHYKPTPVLANSTTNNNKKVPFDNTAYRSVPVVCEDDSDATTDEEVQLLTRPPDNAGDGADSESESKNSLIDAVEIIGSDEEEEEDDHNESRRRSQTKSDQIQTANGAEKSAVAGEERSDSVIFTGSYTQHDIDLEEISRIRTNGEPWFNMFTLYLTPYHSCMCALKPKYKGKILFLTRLSL